MVWLCRLVARNGGSSIVIRWRVAGTASERLVQQWHSSDLINHRVISSPKSLRVRTFSRITGFSSARQGLAPRLPTIVRENSYTSDWSRESTSLHRQSTTHIRECHSECFNQLYASLPPHPLYLDMSENT